jgi:glutamate racemase
MPNASLPLTQIEDSLITRPAHLIVFDSGVGGLNVLKTLWKAQLGCKMTFVADSAWMPYGNKNPSILQERLLYLVSELLNRYYDNAYILFACNTASAVWESIPPELFGEWGIRPDRVIDILRPTLSLLIRELIQSSPSPVSKATVGLMATPLTVASQAYPSLAKRLYGNSSYPQLVWHCVPCADLAQAVEGDASVEAVETLVERYASQFQEKPPHALIIGCTHYLGLKAQLRHYMPNTLFIDPSEALVFVICGRLGIPYETPKDEHLAEQQYVSLWATGERQNLESYLQHELPMLKVKQFKKLSVNRQKN